MKTMLIAIMILLTTTISAQDKYDQLMQKMEIESQIKEFINNYIDKLASESNGVSVSKWQTIKSKINYSTYLISIKSILQEHYPLNEIDNIFKANDMVASVNDTGKFIYKPKPIVREKMYQLSRQYGKTLNEKIKKLIQE
ncbi:hypothetical protein Q4Q34_15215 [Flavivirga abyssicola]|uniref:hypothetical protein n=1 Tax=Flavivirga abyssicola TaxID=3063533 RepID=UPI0026DF62F4|nr:hypothetical protein [Flavivirga sp. MEBiC07777]WVK12565.1 hypothetical protein Q4Q34_15215 [Flavivirga sp. MEBiC07777]